MKNLHTIGAVSSWRDLDEMPLGLFLDCLQLLEAQEWAEGEAAKKAALQSARSRR